MQSRRAGSKGQQCVDEQHLQGRRADLTQPESPRGVPGLVGAQPDDLPDSRQRRRQVESRRAGRRLSLSQHRS